MKIVIHQKANPLYTARLKRGFRHHGFTVRVTDSSYPVSCDIPVLVGHWPECEKGYDEYLAVDTAFIGNRREYVAIGWNGFGGRGFYCVNGNVRLRQHKIRFKSWRRTGEYLLLLGQNGLGGCRRWLTLRQWLDHIQDQAIETIIYRGVSDPLPLAVQGRLATAAISLNSLISVDCLALGLPVITQDHGNPCYAVTGHTIQDRLFPSRKPLFEYLSQCQYHYSELDDGSFWDQLRGPRGDRLYEADI